MKVITRASKLVSKFSLSSSRIAAGHPEGFFEAFANIYSEFADQIHNKNKKYSFPTIDDGVAHEMHRTHRQTCTHMGCMPNRKPYDKPMLNM